MYLLHKQQVQLQHILLTLLSTGGATRFPPPIQFDYRLRLVTTGLTGVGSTHLSTSGSMSQTTDTNIAPITCSCPAVVPTGPVYTTQPVQRRGKAPSIDPFTAEDPEIRFDDWLPTLERAAAWNGWSEEETLMQLAGYLRNRALQEWNLLNREDRGTYEEAVKTLRA